VWALDMQASGDWWGQQDSACQFGSMIQSWVDMSQGAGDRERGGSGWPNLNSMLRKHLRELVLESSRSGWLVNPWTNVLWNGGKMTVHSAKTINQQTELNEHHVLMQMRWTDETLPKSRLEMGLVWLEQLLRLFHLHLCWDVLLHWDMLQKC